MKSFKIADQKVVILDEKNDNMKKYDGEFLANAEIVIYIGEKGRIRVAKNRYGRIGNI